MERRVLLVALILALSLASASAYLRPSGPRDLAGVMKCLEQEGNYKTFLSYLKQSGFAAVIGRYVNSQAVTFLVPTDLAFARLPQRIKSQLKGSSLIKFLEGLMLLHNYPEAYLQTCIKGSFFDTVGGNFLYKQQTALKGSIAFSTTRKATPTNMAVVVKADLCSRAQATIATHAINQALIPADLFKTMTH